MMIHVGVLSIVGSNHRHCGDRAEKGEGPGEHAVHGGVLRNGRGRSVCICGGEGWAGGTMGWKAATGGGLGCHGGGVGVVMRRG